MEAQYTAEYGVIARSLEFSDQLDSYSYLVVFIAVNNKNKPTSEDRLSN
jgi:hypothetical protein